MADHELEILRDALRNHVNALAVDIGPRTTLNRDTLLRAANYIHSVFDQAGLTVSEQDYQYHDQRVTNVLATVPVNSGASAYYVVGAHYDTAPCFEDRVRFRLTAGLTGLWESGVSE